MKKISIFFIFLWVLLFLMSCMTEEEIMEDLKSLENTMIEQIPDEINSNFKLNISDTYQVTYTLFDQVNEGEFVYESPFFDKKGMFKISISKNNSTLDIEKEVTLVALDSGLNQTKIYLHVDGDISQINKDEYLQTSVVVETKVNGNKEMTHDTTFAKIRGRGNSTWNVYEKKPYRLRFDKNTSILGMREAKNYVLLAEFADKSLIRNAITHKMSTLFSNISYTLPVRFIELYINQEYLGVYLLTEQVENHPNKLDLNAEAGVLNTDYLFELDMRFYEQNEVVGHDWFTVDRHAYQIKDPDPDDINYINGHSSYLENYMIELENALINQSGYENYLNVDQAIDFLLIHEITKNIDVGWSSVFMIKHKDGPISYGPLWDFDFAYGNTNYNDYGNGPEGWYGMREWKNRMFILLMKIPIIRAKFSQRFEVYYQDVLPVMEELIPTLYHSISGMAERNFERWPILDTYIWPNPQEMVDLHTHELQVEFVLNYLQVRSNWLKNAMEGSSYPYGFFE